jgi:hypothetical protein
MAKNMRTLGIIILLATVGFLIYGTLLPNNPPDLIIGGVVVLIGMSVCALIGGVLFLGSFIVQLHRERND